MFLTTPVNGQKDLCLQAGYSLPADAAGMKAFNSSIAYHSYATDHLNAGIGSEWDAQGELIVDANLTFLVKYADYQGAGTAFGGFNDKSIVWLQATWKYRIPQTWPPALKVGVGVDCEKIRTTCNL